MQNELLLEIGTEEIPAGFIGPALQRLQTGMAAKLSGLGLDYADIRTVATPRRLAISVSGLASQQPDRTEEFLGPARKAAFDGDNRPTKAAEGFARSKGASVDDLTITETAKGEYVMLVKDVRGEETVKLLPSLLSGIIQELSFPKSMRWGTGEIAFARPIHWLLALYEGKVVNFQVGDIASGSHTRGHRFMAPESLEIQDFDHYLNALRDKFVLADVAERREVVINEVKQAAINGSGVAEATIVEDDELIDTVTNLVEYPHGICGSFEERFLALPDDVLITSMREHQKYFCVTGADGKLLANFVAVNNTRVADKKLAAAGHQRVLRARLEDALFFFNDDRTRKLEDRVSDLSGLIFQTKLGTMQEKTERIIKLTSILARQLAPASAAQAVRAALLAKADLLTAMVNEFPSLQGTMGRDYALLDNEEPAVSTAILEHYLPVRAGTDLPKEIPGALVGMADRIDTIVGCFGIGQIPTGTTDPFGLRRLALGLLHIIERHGFAFSLADIIEEAFVLYGDKLTEEQEIAKSNILDFIKGRFVNDLVARGIPGTAVDAVTSVSFVDVVDCRARIDALAAIREQPAFTVLAAAFKRVMNIVKGHHDTDVNEELLQEKAERSLYETFNKVSDETRLLLDNKEYGKAMAVILKMKEPVDTFFDEVMVMTDDLALQKNRLSMLTAIAELFLEVGDFSKMQSAAK
jgi:glycyl-tRNA synthetase beta chain